MNPADINTIVVRLRDMLIHDPNLALAALLGLHPLTPRERDYLRAYVANGGRVTQAAIDIGLSPRTAHVRGSNYHTRIVRKMRSVMARDAVELG